TILPELAILEFGKTQLKLVKRLQPPYPAREVSLVTHRDHIKTRLIETLRKEILEIVPTRMHQLRNKKIVEITY
ncbi:MAG TPA: hydrogen peroxide-inducible genes activator, partial [Lacibacter sp.]|nr:hydrogen peroxide-inducible genes activator [Lacibacter sp.]